MNLRWSTAQHRFEVEFQNFPVEQPLVKAAGFKTDGPPAWVWYSIKAAPLTKLRETKGSATLTITPEARAEYIRLKELEDRNAATKALLAKHNKELKKKLQSDKQDAMKPDEYMDPIGFVCIRVSPKSAPPVSSYDKTKITLTERCVVCKEYLFEYEYSPTGPKVCLWCCKIVLDSSTEVC